MVDHRKTPLREACRRIPLAIENLLRMVRQRQKDLKQTSEEDCFLLSDDFGRPQTDSPLKLVTLVLMTDGRPDQHFAAYKYFHNDILYLYLPHDPVPPEEFMRRYIVDPDMQPEEDHLLSFDRLN